VYGRQWGLTLSQSFSPWQFEVDPVQAAENAMLDAVITQVIAGVRLTDICLADNFYTPNKDIYAYWYLSEQVKALAKLSMEFRTPFITGKDSSSGSSTFVGYVISVLISVCITAMGKIRDARRLKLHQWQMPGNLIFAIGPQAKTLDGSILSAALGITGIKLDNIPKLKTREYMEAVSKLCRSESVKSVVPINRGGIILRLFEGVVASGYGFEAELCEELFPESFGTALIEVGQKDAGRIERLYPQLEPMLVGRIVPEKGLSIQGKELNFNRLYRGWNTTFERTVAR
jgi:phosphoribosylformylglycinamidine (FGAM) synthase-like enzyme